MSQKLDEALDLLGMINADELDDPEFADYAFTYFYMAAVKKTRATLERAEVLLKKSKTPEAHFEKRRLQYLINVKDAIVAINESKPLSELTGIYGKLDNLSRYTVLQPNFFGVGVNLNNIINDMVERARTSERK